MGASADSQTVGSQSGRWVSGLFGGSKVRGEVVCGRLDAFVAPIVEEEPKDQSYVDWVQLHNAKVRESLRGSANLTQRLSGESDELEQERPPERVLKGEAFVVKMIEQRLRLRSSKRSAEGPTKPSGL